MCVCRASAWLRFPPPGGGSKASKEEEEERDAWLDGEAAKPVSEEVLRRLQEREKAEAAVRVAPLTGRELAAIKAQIAGMLQPRETVAKALKRLGTAPGAQHRAMGKREKQKLLVAQQQAAAAAAAAAGKGSGSGGPAAAAAESDLPPAAQIALLTELAHRLLNEGETDVYSDVREDFLHAAELYMPPAAAAAAATGATFTAAATGGGGGGGGDMFADDGDDDMFGADDNSLDKAAAAKQPPPQQPASGDSAVAAAEAAAAAPGAAPPPAAAAAAAATEPSTSAPSAAAAAAADDFASWPIKELKRYLTENGVDVSGMVEKGEMVARAREAAARGPLVNGGGAAPSPANAASVPPGYDFHDPSTGYYWSSAAGMYFDPSTSGYYQPSMQKWFVFKDGTFVEWSG